ncbi:MULTISPECIES: hypothetical protein [Halomonas]|uniref:hypothetical protein n=1 Tax=Halomonas TaxID=2745 RepID=UPI001404EF66|nr:MULTISPECIES: hypothetical protein [Halomonas]MDR5903306.1 hypothetical protein [Halomonas icarae]
MYVYRLMLFLVFIGYLLSPLMMSGWANPDVAWYRPFIIWGVLIALTLWLEQKRKLDER